MGEWPTRKRQRNPIGKRSNFERMERDFYPTPRQAIPALIPHLKDYSTYAEICAGDGALIDWLDLEHMECRWASDIDPKRKDIQQKDVFDIKASDLEGVDVIITNPPWTRIFLHKLIEFLMTDINKPTFLLFDADWMHTKQSSEYMQWLRKAVSVGRLKWIEGSPHTGKDNCVWYFFDKGHGSTKFYGR